MNHPISFTKIVKRASETLLVRFPAVLTLASFPSSVGLFLFFFSNPSPPEGNFWFQIHSLHDLYLQDYIRGFHVGLILSLAFFVSFRWNQIIKDRSYGYWLSQGVDRTQFFLYSTMQFLGIILVGIILGQLILFYPGGSQLVFLYHIRIIFILFSSAYLAYSLAIMISEIVRDPEIALLLFAGIGLLNSSITIDGSGFLQMTFLNGRYALGSLSILPIVSPLLVGTTFLAIANWLHKRRDIDL